MNILGITGKKRHGKTLASEEAARFLKFHGYQVGRYDFAYPLKKLIIPHLVDTSCQDISLQDVDRYLKKARMIFTCWRCDKLVEAVNLMLYSYGLPLLTAEEITAIRETIGLPLKFAYRRLQQFIGTEIFRSRDPDFWVKLAEDYLNSIRADYVIIGDVRFPNEASLIKKHNGILIKVVRPNYKEDDDNHISEKLIYSLPVDYTITAKCKAELRHKIIQLVNRLYQLSE